MKTIKIKSRGFQTTHYGAMTPGRVVEVSDGFADYCVKRMGAAEYVDMARPKTSRKRKIEDS